jgi:hypothetical protein
MKLRCSFVPALIFCLLSLGGYAPAQQTGNSDVTYQALRTVGFGESVGVTDLTLKRDSATFHLHSGTLCFLAPVQGKVTGAVFTGDGNLVLNPPLPIEMGMLKLLTKSDVFSENFSEMMLRFTDATYDEVKKAASGGGGSCAAGPLEDSRNVTRKKVHYNLEARILQDVLGTEPGGLFVAFIHGKRYNDKMIFAIDPHGAPNFARSVAPEEVELITWDENKFGVWAAHHYSEEYKKGTASSAEQNETIRIEHQQLEASFDKGAHLTGKAATTIVSAVNGQRVIPFALFSTLRVQSVSADGGQSVSFIQEDKKADPDFWVILSKPLAAGEKLTITTTYDGKEAVVNTGGGNYFPVAREDWYPNLASLSFGAYSNYDMTIRVPKGMQVAATGNRVSDTTQGDQNVTVWKSEAPLAVAGFSFGKFKKEETKTPKGDYLVQSYANQEPPDWVKGIQQAVSGELPTQGSHVSEAVLGTMDTTSLNKKALAEGQLAMQIYNDYFGPVPYKTVALTQQTACGFGQAWPGLVYIPICYYFDTTVRHQFGLDLDRGYWRVVTPHEVAHQWWGHAVGFNSYRDQWMSEGFSEASASIYIQAVYQKEPKKYFEFWNDERDLLLERNKEGYRAIDAGPLTLGYRLSNSRSGFDITRRLIYPKGGYILHMIRMMLWNNQQGDANFKALMQDFVRSYANRAATTEDFKAMVEKHMTRDMNLDGNGKMDWFFNEYVYGTALPKYNVQSSFETGPDGDVVMNFTLSQSGVDDKFAMAVPLYLQLADGRTVFLGRMPMRGNKTLSQKVPIRGLKQIPKTALVNYNFDVLAEK